VAKSSLERTRVPRRVTNCLTVRRLVNINPGRPRTSSTAAPRKPQHHRLRSPRASPSSSKCMVSSEPSRKRGKEEVLPPPPVEPKEEPLTPPAESEEVPPPPPAEPEEVPPPPPEEVKRLKSPRRKVARQPVVPLRAPKVDYSDACFSVKMLYEVWQSLGKLADHLGLRLQGQCLCWEAGERSGPPTPSTTTTTMAASTSPAPAPTLTPTLTMGLLQRRLPLLN
jgi:hypothetical protein